jgi:hypothetical protein
MQLVLMEIAVNAQFPMIDDVPALVLQPVAALQAISSNMQFSDGRIAVAATAPTMLLLDNGTPGGRFLGQLDTSRPGASPSVYLIALVSSRIIYASGSWLGIVALHALQSILACEPHLGDITHLLAGERYV